MKLKYDARWFQGISAEEREARVKELNSAQWAFDLLEELLVKERKPMPSDYDISNWACKAAHANGANKTIDSILHLIKPREG